MRRRWLKLRQRRIENERTPLHYDYDGHPLCGAPSAGAYVVDHAENITCPLCRHFAPRFVDRPEGHLWIN